MTKVTKGSEAFVKKMLEIHNYYSYPDSQFYEGDKTQFKGFRKKVLEAISTIGNSG